MHTLTHRGKQTLLNEKNELQKKRAEALDNMVRMRELGDLSENAGYRAAKSKLRRIDARIRWIHKITSLSKEVIAPEDTQLVSVGACVKIKHLSDSSVCTFTLVDTIESDIAQGLISVGSPVGRALISKRKGDVAVIRAPQGEREIVILDVKY